MANPRSPGLPAPGSETASDARFHPDVAGTAGITVPPGPLILPLCDCREQAEMIFDGSAFIVSVKCSGCDQLEVFVEQISDASTWNASFSAKCA